VDGSVHGASTLKNPGMNRVRFNIIEMLVDTSYCAILRCKKEVQNSRDVPLSSKCSQSPNRHEVQFQRAVSWASYNEVSHGWREAKQRVSEVSEIGDCAKFSFLHTCLGLVVLRVVGDDPGQNARDRVSLASHHSHSNHNSQASTQITLLYVACQQISS